MTAYYNEIDPYAAQWLRNLIAAGHIAPGDVDERSIEDIKPYELRPYKQCHFFAGIGVWSYALRLANWSDERPVWTGSCPCQPFSEAGKGNGFDDPRHLWPDWYWLIKELRPDIIFGEQVASKDANPWFDLVRANMERLEYAIAGVPFPSSGVGAPHIRDRLYWLADSKSNRWQWAGQFDKSSGRHGIAHGGAIDRLADAYGRPIQESGRFADQRNGYSTALSKIDNPGPTNGFWRDSDWIMCRDKKWRPVESGTFPLVDGLATRVGQLRAYGNAINAQAAKTFIESYLDVTYQSPITNGVLPDGK